MKGSEEKVKTLGEVAAEMGKALAEKIERRNTASGHEIALSLLSFGLEVLGQVKVGGYITSSNIEDLTKALSPEAQP